MGYKLFGYFSKKISTNILTIPNNQKMPDIGKNVGRPKKEISDNWKTIIKQQYEKTWCGAVYLEKK
ncbi:MAG: hypothetical protein LBE76_09370 [Nitrososphaerota archaeon]|jgi:hypothetical protein|nr:hypothetical protein [Nitrososphaerota archaeon]